MTVEIKTRLVVDGNPANAALGKTAQGFAKVAEEAHKTEHSMGGFIKQAASTAAGVYLPRMVEGAFHMAHSFFEVAASAQESSKSFAGLYSMFRDIPFAQATAEAKAMKSELWEMSVAIGQEPKKAYSTFQTVARAMGATTRDEMRAARLETEQLMEVSEGMGMQVEELTEQFAMLEKSPRLMRGPLFDILRATGLFGKDLATMNKNWQSMSDHARKVGVAKALEQQAEKLKGLPRTFQQMETSLGTIWSKAKEEIGTPILEAVMPIAEQFVTGLKAALPELKTEGVKFGKLAAEGLQKAFQFAKDAFSYVRSHSDEIKKAISEAADKIRSAFAAAWKVAQFLWDHKELFGAMAVAAKVGPAVVPTVSKMAQGAEMLPGLGKGASEFGAMLNALGGAGVLAGIAAIIGLISVIDQGSKLVKETAGGLENTQNATAYLEAAERELAAGHLDAAKQALSESQAIQKTYLVFSSTRSKQRSKTDELSKSIDDAASAMSRAQSLMDSVKIPEGLDKSFEAARQTSTLIEAYNTAAGLGNQEMMAQAATMMAQAGITKDMIDQAGIAVVGGLEHLASSISMEAFKTYDEFLAAAGAIGGKGGAKAPEAEKSAADILAAAKGGGGINMSGGQTFNIKQDFRDQDPDRVAVVFQRDLVRAATRRVQSNRATVFGI